MTPSEPVTAFAFFDSIPAGSSGASPDQTRIESPALALNPAVSGTIIKSKRHFGRSMILLGRFKSGKLSLIKLQSEFGDLSGKLGGGVLADGLAQVVADLETVARLCQLALGVRRGHLLASH